MDQPDEQPSDEQKELEEKLGLESIRDLPVEKLPLFLQELPSMSKEAVAAVVASLPDFENLVKGSLDRVQAATNSVLKANWKSQKKVHHAFAEYRRMIDRELESGPLDLDDRIRLLELVKEAIELEAKMNEKHQAFALATVKTVAVAGAAIGAVVVASAAALISNQTDNKS
ncbi:hypothetical protein [Brachybacterium paraconglomeratum]|uniref:hypothetical protein n=1 Tax=Brachybacterium paraconglomeratum TaxID=173362 RepID=UPI00223B2AF9|nr:hypothetical protein [Brachybacterium paraconglomeratum]MCT1435950.1 hypothetical protein [Brachybacterium paraconglomeratum]